MGREVEDYVFIGDVGNVEWAMVELKTRRLKVCGAGRVSNVLTKVFTVGCYIQQEKIGRF